MKQISRTTIEDITFRHNEYCNVICQSTYIALMDHGITMHLNSIKPNRNKT